MKIILLCKNTLIFCSLLALIFWFYVQTKAPRINSQQTAPQEYMIEFKTTNYNTQGKPKESLRAYYWEFKPTLGYSDLTKPQVTVYKDNGEIWYITANKALAWHPTINDKVTKINMQNGVLIERPQINQQTPVSIETLSLEYTPDKEMITTNDFISMCQPGLTISGYGLVGYLDRNWIELHDKITTIYTPN